MRAQVVNQRRNDPAAYFSLAWTTAISFVLLLGRDSPDPLLFLPIAMAALPFTAAPRHQVLFRILAALLLTGFLVTRGPGVEGILFVPAVGAMLLSAYRLSRGGGRAPRGHARRAHRR